MVAVKVPLLELNVKFDPDFAAKYPSECVANKGKQVVSEDSSITLILSDPVVIPVTPPSIGPTNLVAVITPTS